MRLGTFEARTHMEETAIRVLLSENIDEVNEVNELDDEQMDQLKKCITRIRRETNFMD